MKLELEREKRLPAFELTPADAAHLWETVLDQFRGETDIRSRFSVRLSDRLVKFDDPAELRSNPAVKGQANKFSLEVGEWGKRRVRIECGSFMLNEPTVTVYGEDELWIAQVIASVEAVLRPHSVWYNWFGYFPFGMVTAVMGLTPYGVAKMFPDNALLRGAEFQAVWYLVMAVAGLMWLVKAYALPAATITFTKELGFVRRHLGEIGFFLAVVSLLVGLVPIFFPA